MNANEAARPGGGKAPPAISVVVPAMNEEGTIRAALQPLMEESVPGGLEIIVAVAPSMDQTRAAVEEIARRDPRMRLVDNHARATPVGLNLAIAASRGDVILRMDGHAIPEPGYVAACLAVLELSGAWNVGGEIRKVGRTPSARAAAAATSSSFGIGGGRRFHLATEAADVDTVWPGCWPRWVFDRIGLFDPEMVRNQDDEFNQRILDAGGRIRFDPSIKAAYESRASWRGLARQYFGYGLYKVRGLQKRPRLIRLRHLAPAAFVATIAWTCSISLVDRRWAAGLAAVLAAWSISAVAAARRVAGRHDASVPTVVAAYACIHFGYGLGMWAGMFRFAHRWVVGRRGYVPGLMPRTIEAGLEVVEER